MDVAFLHADGAECIELVVLGRPELQGGGAREHGADLEVRDPGPLVFVHRGRVTLDRRKQARVQGRSRHRGWVELLHRRLEGHAQRRQTPPERGDVGRETGAHRLAHAAASQRHRAGHGDGAELLGKALDVPADERELAVHPDAGNTAHLPALEEAVEHAVRLVVLPHRGVVADAWIVIRGRAPVGEDEARASVAHRGHARREELRDPLGIRGEIGGDDLAGVVPGRGRQQGGFAGGALRQGPSFQRHGRGSPVGSDDGSGKRDHLTARARNAGPPRGRTPRHGAPIADAAP